MKLDELSMIVLVDILKYLEPKFLCCLQKTSKCLYGAVANTLLLMNFRCSAKGYK